MDYRKSCIPPALFRQVESKGLEAWNPPLNHWSWPLQWQALSQYTHTIRKQAIRRIKIKKYLKHMIKGYKRVIGTQKIISHCKQLQAPAVLHGRRALLCIHLRKATRLVPGSASELLSGLSGIKCRWSMKCLTMYRFEKYVLQVMWAMLPGKCSEFFFDAYAKVWCTMVLALWGHQQDVATRHHAMLNDWIEADLEIRRNKYHQSLHPCRETRKWKSH